MTVYISGAISNDPRYKKKFRKAEKRLRKHFDVINPAKILSGLPKNTPYAAYMDLSLDMVKYADCIYMLKGWCESHGAMLEYNKAKELGLVIAFER